MRRRRATTTTGWMERSYNLFSLVGAHAKPSPRGPYQRTRYIHLGTWVRQLTTPTLSTIQYRPFLLPLTNSCASVCSFTISNVPLVPLRSPSFASDAQRMVALYTNNFVCNPRTNRVFGMCEHILRAPAAALESLIFIVIQC